MEQEPSLYALYSYDIAYKAIHLVKLSTYSQPLSQNPLTGLCLVISAKKRLETGLTKELVITTGLRPVARPV